MGVLPKCPVHGNTMKLYGERWQCTVCSAEYGVGIARSMYYAWYIQQCPDSITQSLGIPEGLFNGLQTRRLEDSSPGTPSAGTHGIEIEQDGS